MLTGELRNQIDSIWNDFWSGGIANPLQVIEQITYLIFIKRLDEMQELAELRSTRFGEPLQRRIFPEGYDGRAKPGDPDQRGEPYENLRWSRFKNFERRRMFEIVDEHVFPFIRELGDSGSAYAQHMRDARFQIPSSQLLDKVVAKLDKLQMRDRDPKGDVYEYMLAKIATAGQNGQFRTPRHIIAMMVELVAPTPQDVICDPACGTCGFLVAANEYVRKHHQALFRDERLAATFPQDDVQRLRLRPDHAAHRRHEHGAPRHRRRQHLLPRQPRRRARRRHRPLLAGPRQSSVRRKSGLRDRCQGLAARRQDQEDRAAVPGGVFAGLLHQGFEIQTDEFWQDITLPMLETVRRRLRALVKLIEHEKWPLVYSDFEDRSGAANEIIVPGIPVGTDIDAFRRKARQFLKPYENHLAVIKVRRNEPLTATDLSELEHIFIEAGADGTSLAAVEADGGLSRFVRSLVGLDREAAQRAFSEFLVGRKLTANQNEFLNMVIDHLTARGVMDPKLLYEAPFTDFDSKGVEGVFEQADVVRLVEILREIEPRPAA